MLSLTREPSCVVWNIAPTWTSPQLSWICWILQPLTGWSSLTITIARRCAFARPIRRLLVVGRVLRQRCVPAVVTSGGARDILPIAGSNVIFQVSHFAWYPITFNKVLEQMCETCVKNAKIVRKMRKLCERYENSAKDAKLSEKCERSFRTFRTMFALFLQKCENSFRTFRTPFASFASFTQFSHLSHHVRIFRICCTI